MRCDSASFPVFFVRDYVMLCIEIAISGGFFFRFFILLEGSNEETHQFYLNGRIWNFVTYLWSWCACILTICSPSDWLLYTDQPKTIAYNNKAFTVFVFCCCGKPMNYRSAYETIFGVSFWTSKICYFSMLCDDVMDTSIQKFCLVLQIFVIEWVTNA